MILLCLSLLCGLVYHSLRGFHCFAGGVFHGAVSVHDPHYFLRSRSYVEGRRGGTQAHVHS